MPRLLRMDLIWGEDRACWYQNRGGRGSFRLSAYGGGVKREKKVDDTLPVLRVLNGSVAEEVLLYCGGGNVHKNTLLLIR